MIVFASWMVGIGMTMCVLAVGAIAAVLTEHIIDVRAKRRSARIVARIMEHRESCTERGLCERCLRRRDDVIVPLRRTAT